MKEFKPLLLFLARFLGTYIILSIAYKLYLDQYLPHNIPDPFTKFTSDITAFFLNKFGFFSFSNIAENQPWMRLIVDGQVASIVNEGCNAIYFSWISHIICDEYFENYVTQLYI